MTIRIHIGAHKTATSELQQALFATRVRLARGKMAFAGPQILRGQEIALHMALRGGAPDQAERVAAQFDALVDGHSNLLISEENIIGTTARSGVIGSRGQLYPAAQKQMRRMLSLLRGRPVVLFMATRDPANFVTSTYSQQLRRPLPLHHEVYLRDFRLEAMSWTDLARRLLELEEVQQIICWRYEDYALLRPQILTQMVGRRAAGRVPPPKIVNSGISRAAYEAFVEAALADSETPTQELLREACRTFPKLPGAPAMRILPPETHAESRRQYAQDIAELAGLERIRMLAPPDPTAEVLPAGTGGQGASVAGAAAGATDPAAPTGAA